MTIHSPWASALLVFFAVIGILAVVALLGMAGMHFGMMRMMGPEMAEACRAMMQAPG